MKITRPISPSSLAEEPSCKRQKKGSNEVYVVLQPLGPADCDHYIYIVDLNQNYSTSSLVQRDPAFRLDNFPYNTAFAILNSNLYVFGGTDGFDWETSSYSYRLSPQSQPCDIDFKQGINCISPMQYKKYYPCAVLIGARICVFSAHLYCNRSNFEMYDPDANEWSSFPEPPIDFTNLREGKCVVRNYCVENLLFMIFTLKGSYSIDLSQQRSNWLWVPCNLPLMRSIMLRPAPFLKDSDFIFSPFLGVYDLTHQQPQPLNFRCMQNQSLKPQYNYILSLPKGSEARIRACIFVAGGPKLSDSHWPTDSMLGFYVFEFGENDTKNLSPTILNSSMFHLDREIFTYKIQIIGVFPV